MVDNSDLRAEISAYLGKVRTGILDMFSKQDWDLFEGLNINPKKSYFVKGSKAKLKKFEAYFLFLCAYNKPLHKSYLFEEYARILSAPVNSENNDLDEVGVDRELVILYLHDVQMGIGNTTGWITVTVLNKIANRNRQGNVTLVLSERDFIPLQNTTELEYVNLGGATSIIQAGEIAEKIAKGKEKEFESSSNKQNDIKVAEDFKKVSSKDFD